MNCKQYYKKEEGTTLVELLVSLAIFTIFVSVAVGGFVQALSNQRLVLALMESTDNMSFVLEQIMREMRVSTDFEQADENSIQFVRVESVPGGGDAEYLIQYQYDSGNRSIVRIKTLLLDGSPTVDVQEANITAENVEVTDFRVIQQRTPPGPERFTITVGVSASDRGRTVTNSIQTTVSSRLF
jgi:type II secretory pathway component PulJ